MLLTFVNCRFWILAVTFIFDYCWSKNQDRNQDFNPVFFSPAFPQKRPSKCFSFSSRPTTCDHPQRRRSPDGMWLWGGWLLTRKLLPTLVKQLLVKQHVPGQQAPRPPWKSQEVATKSWRVQPAEKCCDQNLSRSLMPQVSPKTGYKNRLEMVACHDRPDFDTRWTPAGFTRRTGRDGSIADHLAGHILLHGGGPCQQIKDDFPTILTVESKNWKLSRTAHHIRFLIFHILQRTDCMFWSHDLKTRNSSSKMLASSLQAHVQAHFQSLYLLFVRHSAISPWRAMAPRAPPAAPPWRSCAASWPSPAAPSCAPGALDGERVG